MWCHGSAQEVNPAPRRLIMTYKIGGVPLLSNILNADVLFIVLISLLLMNYHRTPYQVARNTTVSATEEQCCSMSAEVYIGNCSSK